MVAREWGDVRIETSASRRLLVDLIRARPGIHKSELCRRSGLSWGTVHHHIRVLTDLGVIRARRIGGRVHFASVESVRDHHMARALMMPLGHDIIKLLQANRSLGPAQLSKALDVSPKILRSHLQILMQEGLISSDGAYHPRYWVAAHALSGIRPPHQIAAIDQG